MNECLIHLFFVLFSQILSACEDHLANNQFIIGLKYWLIKIVTPVSNPLPRDTEHKQEQLIAKGLFWRGEQFAPCEINESTGDWPN